MRSRPAYADAYTGMGISLKELKRREEAEACFQQVVRLRPGCALSLGNYAGAASRHAHAPAFCTFIGTAECLHHAEALLVLGPPATASESLQFELLEKAVAMLRGSLGTS